MDPKILEMRRAAAERYKRAAPEEKPQIRICDVCKEQIYDSKVCKVTGLLHEQKRTTLVGGKLVDADKKQMTCSELIDSINAIRVRWEQARVEKASIDGTSMTIFQTFVVQRKFELMRYGIMYGTVRQEGGKQSITVDSIYEPEQSGSQQDWNLEDDPRVGRVDQLAQGLGLRRVGIVITHQPRDRNECLLTGKELLALAKDSSRFGDHCTLVTLSPNMADQALQVEAWQVSKQCINLYQLGLFSESTEDLRYVKSSTPLEIAQTTTDEKGHSKAVIKEPAANVDTRWMTAPVAVEAFETAVIRNSFIRISRPGLEPPNMMNLKNVFNDPKYKSMNFVQKISDFHILIFLMQDFFGEKEFPQIVAAVVAQDNAAVAAYEAVFKAHFGEA